MKKPGGAHPKKDGDGALAAPAADSAKALTKEIAEATGTTVGSIEQIKAIEHKAPEIAAAAKAGKKSIRAALGWEQLKPLLKKPGQPKKQGKNGDEKELSGAPDNKAAEELTKEVAKAAGTLRRARKQRWAGSSSSRC